MSMKRIVIGGIPAPIGGVTTYLRRLLHRDNERISYLIDFYPGLKEPVKEDCRRKVIHTGGKLGLIFWLWSHRSEQTGHEVFFNFSTPRGLIVSLLAPRVQGTRWALMLHHGKLQACGWLWRFLLRRALSRFDEIQSLSEEQTLFYLDLGADKRRIVVGSSYCEPVDHIDDPKALDEITKIKAQFGRLIVMSGFPKALYNFQRGIDAIATVDRTEVALCLFIYGPGELRQQLHRQAGQIPWVFLFDCESERYFNTFLRNSDVFLRLTDVESFGISVWDAQYWGLKIVATSSANRPVTSHITSLEEAEANIEKALQELK